MLTTCPHCFTRVVPKVDGTCPACQRDVNDPRGADPTRTSLRVSQGDALPAICCGCGREADRYAAVRCESNWDRDQPSDWVQVLMLLISWPVALYFFLRGMDRTSAVEVKMPVCRRCAPVGGPRPRHVDFENARMTFDVHKKLPEAMAAREGED